MGYHITLSRPESKPEITEQEWKSFIRTRPELTPIEDSAFDTVILNGDMNLPLHYSNGAAKKMPGIQCLNSPQLQAKMAV
jgi:hypothetical protein